MPLKKKYATTSLARELTAPQLARLKLLTKQFFRSLDGSTQDDPPLGPECKKGHILLRVVGVPSTYTTTDMLCDGAGCGRTSVGDKQRNVWHHCAACRYDLCAACAKASAGVASTTALTERDASSARLATKYGRDIFDVLSQMYGDRVSPFRKKWDAFFAPKKPTLRVAVSRARTFGGNAAGGATGGGASSYSSAAHVCAVVAAAPQKKPIDLSKHRGPAPPGYCWTMSRVKGKTTWKLKRRKCAVKKPIIYLVNYDGPVTVSVSLSGSAVVTSTVPPAAEGPGFGAQSATWSVIATPDGTLTLVDKGATSLPVSSLFWESTLPTHIKLDDGGSPTRCVARDDVATYLFRLFHDAGLSTREYTEATQFWAPLMEKHAFVVARLLTTEEWAALAPLTVSPTPEHTLRIFIVWRGVREYDASRDTAPIFDAEAAAPPPRSGRWVVEWGGAEI